MLELPADFVDWRVAQSGDAGRRWLDSLPGLVDQLCARWRLTLAAGVANNGENSVVLPVRRDEQACVLKLEFDIDDLAGELIALRAWAGDGAVQLLDASRADGALLLERLDASRSLHSLNLRPAAEIAGALLRRLAVPAPPGLPRLADIAAHAVDELPTQLQALGDPIPARWVSLATSIARELAADAGSALVHADLHYGNVLVGTREPWLAIDPRAVAGDPAYSVPELMWTRLDEAPTDAAVRALLATLVRAGGLDPVTARATTILRAVAYWTWGLRAGLTEDPLRCRRLLECLAGPG